MPLPPIVTSLTTGVVQTEITGDVVVIGAIEQGDPNAGGADAWPVKDVNSAALLAELLLIGTAIDTLVTSNAAILVILTDVHNDAANTLRTTVVP